LFSDPAESGAVYWMPDGKGILLASRRSGAQDFWSVRVSNGKPEGEPIRVKQNITTEINSGSFWGSVSRDGTYFYSVSAIDRNLYFADLDPATGKTTSAPERANQNYIGSCTGPIAWSPDEQFLAFATVNRSGGMGMENTKELRVRSFPPGKGRTVAITPPLNYSRFGLLKWFTDARSILIDDVENRRTVFRQVEVETGKHRLLLDRPGKDALWNQSVLSNDDKLLYYSVKQAGLPPAPKLGHLVLYRRDLEKGEETKLYEANSTSAGLRSLSLSPDGQQLAFFVDNQDGTTSLRTVPAEGGTHQELYQSKFKLGPCVWTQDSRHLLFVQRDTKAGYQLMSISRGGGDPVFTGLTMPEIGALSVHPDGRRLAFVGGITRDELWTITNVLPGSK
jgi:Tol biopolymer transport system component